MAFEKKGKRNLFSPRGNAHIKVTTVIVGNFEKDPLKAPAGHFVGVACIHS